MNWDDLPIPIRDYITARASAMTSQRVIGDPTQYQMLQQKEAYCRAYALEYEVIRVNTPCLVILRVVLTITHSNHIKHCRGSNGSCYTSNS